MNPSPITPEAEAELDTVLKRLLADVDDSMEFVGTMWNPKDQASVQVSDSLGKAKQSLIRVLVKERVDELKTWRTMVQRMAAYIDSPDSLNEFDDRIAHLESLLKEDT